MIGSNQRDKEIADVYKDSDLYFSLSPTRWSLFRKIYPIIKKNVRGRCLDAGAGRMVYGPKVKPLTEDYISLDWSFREGLSAVGSVQDMPWRDEAFDSILCFQVLEHVPDPERALREYCRALKPGGVLILSVPHLAYLHNEPHDYFRYTKYGLRVLLERVGFSDVEVIPAGGLLSFLGHFPSMIGKAVFHPIPLLNRFVVRLNSIYAKLVAWLDDGIDPRKLFALKFIAIARKPDSIEEKTS